jgi:hypothetical protein
MPQTPDPADLWEFEREAIDLIPLVVQNYNTVAAAWVETTNYTIAVVPFGTRPASANFVSSFTVGASTGYLVNGPTLSASTAAPATFEGYVKISNSPLTPEHLAFTLSLK